MPNGLVHYAFAALLLFAVGVRGRRLALVPLIAILPDLDVVTAIPWWFIGHRLPLGAEAVRTLAWVFAHRGLSHSLLASLLAGGVAYVWKRQARLAVLVAVVWASQPLLDSLTTWPTQPWMPFSPAEVQLPLMSTLDPLATLASLVLALSLLVPLVAHRLTWLDRDRQQGLSRLAQHHQGHAMAVATIGLAIAMLNVPATAALVGAPVSNVWPDSFPSTLLLDRAGEVYVIQHQALPWLTTGTTHVAMVQGDASSTVDQRVRAVACTLGNLGPYDPISVPVYEVHTENGITTVHVTDVVRNVTRDGGPRLTFTVIEGQVTQVMMGSEPGERFDLQVPVPQALVEDAACL